MKYHQYPFFHLILFKFCRNADGIIKGKQICFDFQYPFVVWSGSTHLVKLRQYPVVWKFVLSLTEFRGTKENWNSRDTPYIKLYRMCRLNDFTTQ